MSSKLFARASIAIAALSSLLLFAWPLLISAQSVSESAFAQAVFAVLMPVILVLVIVEYSSGQLDSRRLAVLGVLTALNASIRVLGAGTAGIETVFFLLIIAAYVFGSGFGFLLGPSSLLVSALLTGGVGPWLPFQMMAAGLVGLLAGALPKVAKPRALLIVFAVVASFIYGGLMTLWNWPYLAGTGTSISYSPGADLGTNLWRFLQYELFTGGLLWDAGRAITTSVLIWLLAPALITTLSRARVRAGFQKL